MICFDDVDLPQSRALEIWINELRPRFETRLSAASRA
jgi:hypothetical protein